MPSMLTVCPFVRMLWIAVSICATVNAITAPRKRF